jgi:hypothetical protein
MLLLPLYAGTTILFYFTNSVTIDPRNYITAVFCYRGDSYMKILYRREEFMYSLVPLYKTFYISFTW